MQRADEGFAGEVYKTMWGENDWNVEGNLKGYDRTARLGEIQQPTLFTCGRHDEATPATTAYYRSLVQGAKLVVFEDSLHVPHVEERDEYLGALREFLAEPVRLEA